MEYIKVCQAYLAQACTRVFFKRSCTTLTGFSVAYSYAPRSQRDAVVRLVRIFPSTWHSYSWKFCPENGTLWANMRAYRAPSADSHKRRARTMPGRAGTRAAARPNRLNKPTATCHAPRSLLRQTVVATPAPFCPSGYISLRRFHRRRRGTMAHSRPLLRQLLRLQSGSCDCGICPDAAPSEASGIGRRRGGS